MKIYLIRTTSHDKWEFCEGVYIVAAADRKSALRIFKEKNKEEITEVLQMRTYKEGVLFSQAPQIE